MTTTAQSDAISQAAFILGSFARSSSRFGKGQRLPMCLSKSNARSISLSANNLSQIVLILFVGMVPSEFMFWEQNFNIGSAIARSIASTLALLDVPTAPGTQDRANSR